MDTSSASNNQPHLILIGFMGCGKSSVGSLLAQRLGRDFVDSDTFITDKIGLSINEIFAQLGEAHFRKIEAESIRHFKHIKNPLVIATGGGMPAFHDIRELGEVFYLHADFDTLFARIKDSATRPLKSDYQATRALYVKRLESYEKQCHHKINAKNSIEKITEEILEKILKARNLSPDT